MSRSGAEADAGASSKEEIMQIIGTTWREQRKKEHEGCDSNRRRPERKAGHDRKAREIARERFPSALFKR